MSVCTNLTNQISNLQELHSQFEVLLTDLDQEVTPQKLAQAHQLKEHIKLISKQFEHQTKESIDLVLKERFNLDWKVQLEIYREQDQEDWADDLLTHKQTIINKLKDPKNQPIIEARLKNKEPMIPILMPGRNVQRANWEQSLKDMRPVWRVGGVDKPMNDSVNWAEETWEELLGDPVNWIHIPEQPYIYWTIPTPEITLGLNEDITEQKQTIANCDPKLYGTEPTKDIHPLEYLSLQVLHTHQKIRDSKNTEDIIPFDGKTRVKFPSCGLSAGRGVLFATFGPGRVKLNLSRDDVSAHSGAGVRVVGRL